MSGSLIPLLIGGGILALLLCGGVVVALTIQARESARHAHCMKNLKQIGLAIHNYHDTFNRFPPAYIADENGKPVHSWRVLILPFLGESALYKQYHFDEPWDGPYNSRLLEQMPAVFACPSATSGHRATMTTYAAAIGPNAIFEGARATRMADVTDGFRNTILIGEIQTPSIPWMKPEDVDIAAHPSIGAPGGFGSRHAGGANFLFGDASVHLIPQSIKPQTLQALFTRSGNEVVEEF